MIKMSGGRKGTKLARMVKEGLPEEMTLSSKLLFASGRNPYQTTLSRTKIVLTQKGRQDTED